MSSPPEVGQDGVQKKDEHALRECKRRSFVAEARLSLGVNRRVDRRREAKAEVVKGLSGGRAMEEGCGRVEEKTHGQTHFRRGRWNVAPVEKAECSAHVLKKQLLKLYVQTLRLQLAGALNV